MKLSENHHQQKNQILIVTRGILLGVEEKKQKEQERK